MASRVENDFHCPTCLEIFKDPVMLPCSHSFCRECVQQWWDGKGERTCPVCRQTCGSMDVPLNLALRNLCEAFSHASVESEDVCSLHKEKLKLFCLDHQELVCIICRDAESHTGHKFRPLEEVVKGHKEQLREGLRDAKKRLQDQKEIRDDCNEQAAYIKVQRKQVESKIKKDFEELRRFLEEEEEARLSAVREEEETKSQTMTERIEALDRDMAALSATITSTEEKLTSDPVSFMKNFNTLRTRIQKLPDAPKKFPGALLDEVKHVGNLKFNVWEGMKQVVSYSPVILNPNSARSTLTLSEDLTSVCSVKKQQRPSNPERSTAFSDVIGSPLASGTHTWDVEVGENIQWKVGLAWGDPCSPDDMKAKGITFRDEKYKLFGDALGSWKPSVKVQRIRVHVDTNQRTLSLTESLTDTLLGKTNPSAWPRLSDNIKLFPYFWTTDKIPLQIIPRSPHVTTQSQ
ncbi:tripartite motif-containing protein 35-like [Hippocampus comes]|uniref:tripartite motif-containing protein 35-like n=1 Tax=Hippocampus comes TaxID=109280 RepID=UPI00094E0779|nr:PREDICTED: tripartite motif-containing protein 35-like [Hippocampus comes]